MDQVKTYSWVQDRLRDLHSGTLSEDDRERLEEISKTDPFVRDALEGYKSHADHDHSALLNVLSQRIQNKTSKRRAKLVPLSRGWIFQAVAASLVIILATWAVIYYIEKQTETALVADQSENNTSIEQSTEVELTYPDSMHEDMTAGTISEDGMNEPAGLRANAMAKSKAGSNEQVAVGRSSHGDDPAMIRSHEAGEQGSMSSKSRVNDAVSPSKPEAGGQTKSIATYKTSQDADGNVMDESVQIAPLVSGQIATGEGLSSMKIENKIAGAAGKKVLQRDESFFANQMSPLQMAQRVTGQVMSFSGQPLIGALLNISNTNLVTTTDDYGRFEFYLPQATSSVEVKYTGYQDTTLTVLPGQEDLVIMLEEGMSATQTEQLAGAESKIEKPVYEISAGKYSGSEPTLFLLYLENNSRFPLQHSFNSAGKIVTLEFNISSNRRPQKIKVTQTSGDIRFDEESIRLIKSGPDWSCEDGSYPCMKRYTIYFE